MKPTAEQQDAIHSFQTGKALKVIAYAGSGKTRTLQFLAESTPHRRGTYIAFNQAIAAEANRRFPRAVTCSTTHSVAFRTICAQGIYSSAKLTEKPTARQLATAMQFQDFRLGWKPPMTLRAASYAWLVLQAVKRFCQSDAEAVSRHHFKPTGRLLHASPPLLAQLAAKIAKDAAKAWDFMLDPASPLPLGHDGYLKLWALQRPTLTGDFVLLDEAQDTNEVVLGVLRHQSAQIVLVGDPFQQIYEWRGAINAMERFRTPLTTSLTRSFRFGPVIAGAASAIIKRIGATSRILGQPDIRSHIGPVYPDVVLCRTNVGVMTNLLSALTANTPARIVGGTQDLKKLLEAVAALKNGRPAMVPELYGYASWADVKAHIDDEAVELKTLVGLVEKFGEDALLGALGKCTESEAVEVLQITTGHRGKGLEWNHVRLEEDFAAPFASIANKLKRTKSDRDQERIFADVAAEVRLVYVALTRAKAGVEVPDEILDAFGIAGTSEVRVGERKSPKKVPQAAMDFLAELRRFLLQK